MLETSTLFILSSYFCYIRSPQISIIVEIEIKAPKFYTFTSSQYKDGLTGMIILGMDISFDVKKSSSSHSTWPGKAPSAEPSTSSQKIKRDGSFYENFQFLLLLLLIWLILETNALGIELVNHGQQEAKRHSSVDTQRVNDHLCMILTINKDLQELSAVGRKRMNNPLHDM